MQTTDYGRCNGGLCVDVHAENDEAGNDNANQRLHVEIGPFFLCTSRTKVLRASDVGKVCIIRWSDLVALVEEGGVALVQGVNAFPVCCAGT